VTKVNVLQPSHLAILAVAVIILFGAKRLPDAARSVGKSLRIFKSEVRELHNEKKSEPSATPVQSERVDPPPADGRSA
jgi:sec-independent protein translocase protein TatA